MLLSDLVFNHQAHPAMLTTLRRTLSSNSASASVSLSSSSERTSSRAIGETEEELPDGGRSIKPERPCALVFFSHHRPALAEKDMAFFEAARAEGWTCEEVGRWRMPVSQESRKHSIASRLASLSTEWPKLHQQTPKLTLSLHFAHSPCLKMTQETSRCAGRCMDGESIEHTARLFPLLSLRRMMINDDALFPVYSLSVPPPYLELVPVCRYEGLRTSNAVETEAS